MGRMLIVPGLVILAIGVLVLAEKAGFHRLPGDVRYESPRLKVYFPIITCAVPSILLTLLMWLWDWLRR